MGNFSLGVKITPKLHSTRFVMKPEGSDLYLPILIKHFELHAFLSIKNPKLLLVTETWFSNNKGITDNILDPYHCYNIYRCDRQILNKRGAIKNGGGVCAFVCKSLRSKQVSLSNNCVNSCTTAQTEIICFDIYVAKTTYRIILLYRPPNSCFTNVEHLKLGIDALKTILNELIHVQHTTFICGDFNLLNINRFTNNVILDDVHNNFFDFISSHGMTQFVHQPTRHSSSDTDNVLDLIFSNDSLSVIIKFLGVILSANLNWNKHIDVVVSKISKNICIISKVRHLLPLQLTRNLYFTLVHPYISYCNLVWGSPTKTKQLERIMINTRRSYSKKVTRRSFGGLF